MADERVVRIRLDPGNSKAVASSTNNSVKQIGTSADGASGSLLNMSKAAKAVGAALATAAVAKFFSYATVAAKNFNASLSNLAAITGATGKDLQFLSDAALEFGATTTLSATQATEALKLIASAKPDLLSNVVALKEVTKQAILLAEASGGTLALADAAGTVGKALNQFGEDADQAARFVNVLAAGAKFGSSEVLATSEALKNAGVAAASAGVSFEETNAAIQVLAKNGIEGAEAGTGLRNIFLKLDTDINQNLRPSVVGLSTALTNLKALNEDGAAQVKRFGLENIVAGKSLLSNVDALGSLTTKLTGTNTALDQASTNVDNLDGDLKGLNSAFESLQISVGNLADSQLRNLTQETTSFISALNGNADALELWRDSFEAVEVAAVSLLLVFGAKYASAVTTSITAIYADIAAKKANEAATLSLLLRQKEQAAASLLSAQQTQQGAARFLANSTSATMNAKAITLLATANGKATAAQAQLTAATNAYTAAATRSTFAARGASAAMAFLGGPVGVAIIAAGALLYFAEQAETAKERSERLAGEVDDLTNSFKGLNDLQRQIQLTNLTNEFNETQLKLADANKKLQTFKGFAESPIKTENVRKYQGEVDRLNTKLDQLSVKQQAIFASGLPADSEFSSPDEGVKSTNKDLDSFFSQSGTFSDSSDTPKEPVSQGGGQDLTTKLQQENQMISDSLLARKNIYSLFYADANDLEATEYERQTAALNFNIATQMNSEAEAFNQRLQAITDRQLVIAENKSLNDEQKNEAKALLDKQAILAREEFEGKITQIAEEGAATRAQIEQQEASNKISTYQGYANTALSLASSFGAKSEKDQKKLKKVGVVVDTAAGISRAFAENPWPVALGISAGIAANGIAQIQAINSATPTSGITSGAAPSTTSSTASTASTYTDSASQPSQRIVNFVGLENFGDDDNIPITKSALISLLSSDEDVIVANSTGTKQGQRVGLT